MLVDQVRVGLQGGVAVGQAGGIKLRTVKGGGPGSFCAGPRGSLSKRSPGASVAVAVFPCGMVGHVSSQGLEANVLRTSLRMKNAGMPERWCAQRAGARTEREGA